MWQLFLLYISSVLQLNGLTSPSLLQVSGSRPHQKRVKALVDCRAGSSEQLAFFKDEIIVVTASNDPHWWVSATTTVGIKSDVLKIGLVLCVSSLLTFLTLFPQVGHIEGDASRSGNFPVNYVHKLTD